MEYLSVNTIYVTANMFSLHRHCITLSDCPRNLSRMALSTFKQIRLGRNRSRIATANIAFDSFKARFSTTSVMVSVY